MRSKIKFTIMCPKCGKENPGKRIMLGYNCQKCNYVFSESEKNDALNEVRRLRKLEKQS